MATAMNYSIPTKEEEVTAEWLSTVLNIDMNRDSLIVEGNIHAGVGFLSCLIRVQFEEILKDGLTRKHFYVVKILPPKGTERDLVVGEKMDKSELYFYKTVIPALIKEVPSIEPYFCPFIYGDIIEENKEKDIEPASVLIMQDLKGEGYMTKYFSKTQLSKKEIQLTIDFFAKFHAASNLIEFSKKAKLNEIYDFFPEWFKPNDNLEKPCFIHKWAGKCFQITKDFLLNYVNTVDPSEKEPCMQMISEMIDNLAPHSQEIINAMFRAAEGHSSVVHGDLWQNNILIKAGDSTGDKTTIKIIDWQLMGYSDSSYDVALFLTSVLTPDVTLEKVGMLASIYYDSQEKIFADKEKEQGFKFPGNQRRSWDEFWQAFKTFGMTYVFFTYLQGCDVLQTFPENFVKVYNIFRFLHYEARLTDFLTALVVK